MPSQTIEFSASAEDSFVVEERMERLRKILVRTNSLKTIVAMANAELTDLEYSKLKFDGVRIFAESALEPVRRRPAGSSMQRLLAGQTGFETGAKNQCTARALAIRELTAVHAEAILIFPETIDSHFGRTPVESREFDKKQAA